MRGVLGEEERRLARRVSSAHDEYFLILAGDGLGERIAVIHSGAREGGRAGHVQCPVGNARRNQERTGGYFRSVGKREHPILAVDAEAAGFLRCQQLGAELSCLRNGASREVGAGETAGETEIILDPRAGAGLSARRLAFDQERAKPFRRAINSGRETSRSAADDDEVVKRLLGARAKSEPRRESGRVRRGERLT